MASSSASVDTPYPQSETVVRTYLPDFGVSSNAAKTDLESPGPRVSPADASLAKGAERFLRIDVDASAPAASGSAMPAPMDVVREAAQTTAASIAARVELSPTSAGDDLEMPPTDTFANTPALDAPPSTSPTVLTAPTQNQPPQVRSKAPPPGFRSPARSSPTPSRPTPTTLLVNDGWG